MQYMSDIIRAFRIAALAQLVVKVGREVLFASKNLFNFVHYSIMSWQAYVDTNLLKTGNVQRAAIFGHDGSCWATSAGFSVSVLI